MVQAERLPETDAQEREREAEARWERKACVASSTLMTQCALQSTHKSRGRKENEQPVTLQQRTQTCSVGRVGVDSTERHA